MKYKAWQTLKGETEDKRSSVCASVSIKISQKLVMTREAFEGTLTIFNGNETKCDGSFFVLAVTVLEVSVFTTF